MNAEPSGQPVTEALSAGYMASPQLKNGFLRVANELAEAFARVNLSASEWRLLWVLMRRTYGWSKTADEISYTQFSEASGLDRRHMHRALCSLMARRIITRQPVGISWEYTLQKDYTKWTAGAISGTSANLGTSADSGTRASANLGTTTGADLGTESSAERGTHKRKERNTKDKVKDRSSSGTPSDGRAHALLAHFAESYKARFNIAVVFLAKDHGLAKTLTKATADLDLLKAAVDAYLRSQDLFLAKAGHSFSQFAGQINRWLQAARSGADPGAASTRQQVAQPRRSWINDPQYGGMS